MTFWPLTNSDFSTDQTFYQFHDLYTELDLHRIMSGFHRAFATGVASQQGTLTLLDTWIRPPFWNLIVLQLLRPDSLILLDFSPWIPLGTFSIRLKLVQSTAHSFKTFYFAAIFNIIFPSLCTYYLGLMSCFISFECCQCSSEEHGTSAYHKKIFLEGFEHSHSNCPPFSLGHNSIVPSEEIKCIPYVC